MTGRLRYTAQEGIIVIDDTKVTGVNMSSTTLVVKSENNKSVNVTVQFSVRDCLPGEVNKRGDECDPCDRGTYSFNIHGHCLPCETHAECYGNATLVPADGYWHSTPFSPIMNRCVRSTACKYTERTQRLIQYSANSTRLKAKWDEIQSMLAETHPDTRMPMNFSDYPQCVEGYDGPLCGSCLQHFGRSFSGECKSCPSTVKYTRLFTVLSVLWTFVVIGINCVVTLLSTRMRIELARLEARKDAVQHRPAFKRSPPVTENMVREMHALQGRTGVIAMISIGRMHHSYMHCACSQWDDRRDRPIRSRVQRPSETEPRCRCAVDGDAQDPDQLPSDHEHRSRTASRLEICPF